MLSNILILKGSLSDSIHLDSDVQITDINNNIHKFNLPGKEFDFGY